MHDCHTLMNDHLVRARRHTQRIRDLTLADMGGDLSHSEWEEVWTKMNRDGAANGCLGTFVRSLFAVFVC